MDTSMSKAQVAFLKALQKAPKEAMYFTRDDMEELEFHGLIETNYYHDEYVDYETVVVKLTEKGGEFVEKLVQAT